MTPEAPDTVLEVRGAVKRFGRNTAVNGLSLTVRRGGVVAILGPNGAGKTTTVEMCEGFLAPDEGTVRTFGMDPYKHADQVRPRLGVMLQGGGAYPGIRVGEMVELVASYHADPLDTQWLLETVGLQNHVSTPYRRLSGGQQQRLSLACALVGRPELVFLDEPTAGLDAQSRLAVWDLVRALRRDGVAVVLTTHLMDEAEALADQVYIVDKGSIVASGSPADMIHGADEGKRTTIALETDRPVEVQQLERELAAQGHDVQVSPRGENKYALVFPHVDPEVVAAVAVSLQKQQVLAISLNLNTQSLEDVFLSITGRDIRA
ncbi:MAG TPA: ABC transporter ATP-binding protein [Candidatus Corynebacterium gallistercoris]|uniref:ABC transporter ATP-binding protein n=1 Tax=Candidatus Corynebacterium gallistercoris TaxID=2838530 RepID=A0A9D1URK6_9CORY|nr:ABC transporter ATP-binding protein [Candidatus Corynebacterium gallistercoris]